jgi:hypothetical protein
VGCLWYSLGTEDLQKSCKQMFTNNEVFIYKTVVVNLDHFSLLMLKLE